MGIFRPIMRLYKCIHMYIGCETNAGKLIGIRNQDLLIQDRVNQSPTEYNIKLLGNSIFLYLRQLGDLTEAESKELIKKGLAIGRPNGYTFSNDAFLYLTSLNVDLFGLIEAGYARNIRSIL